MADFGICARLKVSTICSLSLIKETLQRACPSCPTGPLTLSTRQYRVRMLELRFHAAGWVRTLDGACGVRSRQPPRPTLARLPLLPKDTRGKTVLDQLPNR